MDKNTNEDKAFQFKNYLNFEKRSFYVIRMKNSYLYTFSKLNDFTVEYHFRIDFFVFYAKTLNSIFYL